MNDRKLLQQALDAIHASHEYTVFDVDFPKEFKPIVEAIEAALAQHEQKNSIWVLTREINDNNQDGEYFVAAWNQKPTHEMLKEIMGVLDAEHVLAGGGRVEWENEWFYLKEQA